MKTIGKTYTRILHNKIVHPLLIRYRAGEHSARQELFQLLWRAASLYPAQYGHYDTPREGFFLDIVLERLFWALGFYQIERLNQFSRWFLIVMARFWIDSGKVHFLKVYYRTDFCSVSDLVEPYDSQEERPQTDLRNLFEPKKWRVFLLRYPELIEENEISSLAGVFSRGRRREALVRLLRHARCIAGRKQTQSFTALESLNYRISLERAYPSDFEDKLAYLHDRRERLLERIYSDLVVLDYRTISNLVGLSHGVVRCLIHRMRNKILMEYRSTRFKAQRATKPVA